MFFQKYHPCIIDYHICTYKQNKTKGKNWKKIYGMTNFPQGIPNLHRNVEKILSRLDMYPLLFDAFKVYLSVNRIS